MPLKKTNERIPHRKDSDYFYSYENLYWRPTPRFYFVYRFLYFITGPKFVVPILGIVQEKVYFFKSWILGGNSDESTVPTRVSGFPGPNLMTEALPVAC